MLFDTNTNEIPEKARNMVSSKVSLHPLCGEKNSDSRRSYVFDENFLCASIDSTAWKPFSSKDKIHVAVEKKPPMLTSFVCLCL